MTSVTATNGDRKTIPSKFRTKIPFKTTEVKTFSCQNTTVQYYSTSESDELTTVRTVL